MASGGVGSEHGQRSLESDTFNQSFQSFMSKVNNEPTGAELGSFIEQNRNYLEGLSKTNSNVVRDYQKKIYGGYKNRISPEDDALFKTDYADLFAEQKVPTKTPAKAPETGGSVVPMANAAANFRPTPSGAQEDDAVRTYANAHKLDYSVAAQILANRQQPRGP